MYKIKYQKKNDFINNYYSINNTIFKMETPTVPETKLTQSELYTVIAYAVSGVAYEDIAKQMNCDVASIVRNLSSNIFLDNLIDSDAMEACKILKLDWNNYVNYVAKEEENLLLSAFETRANVLALGGRTHEDILKCGMPGNLPSDVIECTINRSLNMAKEWKLSNQNVAQ